MLIIRIIMIMMIITIITIIITIIRIMMIILISPDLLTRCHTSFKKPLWFMPNPQQQRNSHPSTSLHLLPPPFAHQLVFTHIKAGRREDKGPEGIY